MQTCDLLIKDGTVLIKSDVLSEHVDIAVQDGRIVETGTDLWKKYQAAETISGKGKLFMPGLIDSHMHTGQQLLKGLVLDAKPIIWTRVMLPFESTLTPGKMRLSAQAAALEMIKSGTTGFIDAGSYYMEDAAGSMQKAGSGAPCPIPPWMRKDFPSPLQWMRRRRSGARIPCMMGSMVMGT